MSPCIGRAACAARFPRLVGHERPRVPTLLRRAEAVCLRTASTPTTTLRALCHRCTARSLARAACLRTAKEVRRAVLPWLRRASRPDRELCSVGPRHRPCPLVRRVCPARRRRAHGPRAPATTRHLSRRTCHHACRARRYQRLMPRRRFRTPRPCMYRRWVRVPRASRSRRRTRTTKGARMRRRLGPQTLRLMRQALYLRLCQDRDRPPFTRHRPRQRRACHRKVQRHPAERRRRRRPPCAPPRVIRCKTSLIRLRRR